MTCSEPPQDDHPTTILPQLRDDLTLMPGPKQADGTASWLIFDQIRNSYFSLHDHSLPLLQAWPLETKDGVLAQAQQSTDTLYTDEDIEAMISFLYANHLTKEPPENNPVVYAQQEKAATPIWWKQAIHKYLFFRIPLFNPSRFIAATYPCVAVFFHKITWLFIVCMTLTGLYLVGHQWDTFINTFLHFMTFEGAMMYVLSLIVITSFHELGHAYAAHHFKCRVNTIGIAFIVMFPILYTDTTDAWRLTRRRERLLIDIAGMAAELIIAVTATFLWVFLPDGILRSVAFFAATTSWTLSLLINLNPFMRFDGYYILSDLSGITNLQNRSFALGRWKLRELLFGLGQPVPEFFEKWKSNTLIWFSWGTWVYRFFLFLGIAIFIHAFFPKALGIPLFIIEIMWFIGKPILAEIRKWIDMREQISSTKRGRLTLLGGACVLLFSFIPTLHTIKAPAVAAPSEITEIFPSNAGQLKKIYISEGQYVNMGEILFQLSMPDIENRLKQSKLKIELLQSQLNRGVSDQQDRSNRGILRRSLIAEQENHAGLDRLLKDGKVIAPHNGKIVSLHPNLHEGQWINVATRLSTLIGTESFEIIALPSETQAARIALDSPLKFIADDIFEKPRRGTISEITPTAKKAMTDPALLSPYGGSIAVTENQDGHFIPETAIFEIHASIPRPKNTANPDALRRITGTAIIDAHPISPAAALWQRVSAVLIRETDF